MRKIFISLLAAAHIVAGTGVARAEPKEDVLLRQFHAAVTVTNISQCFHNASTHPEEESTDDLIVGRTATSICDQNLIDGACHISTRDNYIGGADPSISFYPDGRTYFRWTRNGAAFDVKTEDDGNVSHVWRAGKIIFFSRQGDTSWRMHLTPDDIALIERTGQIEVCRTPVAFRVPRADLT
jgi:hypothetical protein